MLTLKYHRHYIADEFHLFSLCGTKVPSISCLQDAWRDERRSIEIAMDVWRRCGGHEVHPIKKGARGLIKV